MSASQANTTSTSATPLSPSLSVVNMATRNITESNEQSPLFKLPPEIRNRIYLLTLGGYDVHVNLAQGANWLYVCQAPTSEDDIFDQHKTSKTAPRYLHQHRACEPAVEHHPLSDSIQLPLLRVCRQIYTEAALMPFSSNTFIIRDMRRLERFCHRLTPTQQRAVKSLEFITTEPERPPATTAPFRFEDYTGLRFLRVRMEFMRFDHEDALVEWAHRYWMEALGSFGQGQLASAIVMPYRVSGFPVMQQTREWAAQLEKKLLEVKEVEVEPEAEEKTESEGEPKAEEKHEGEREEKPKRKRKREQEDESVRQQKRAVTRASRGLRALKLSPS